jgi:hypothetical protein
MASTDATPIPVKNQAYRVTFPILDADGDLVTGATGLDSEVSKDGGTFTDCTAEATEIATTSGMYFLDLTATEMNADTVSIIVKTTSSGAKTTPMILYPNKAGGLSVNVTAWAGSATATTNVALKNTLAKTTDITGFNDIAAGAAMTLTSGGIDSIWAKTMTELSSVPGVTASTLSALQWIFLLARNKITSTSTTQLLRNDADSATIGTSTVSDDGTTFVRNEFT